jgi:hypothetical protein
MFSANIIMSGAPPSIALIYLLHFIALGMKLGTRQDIQVY